MSDSEEEESPDHQLKLVVLGDGTTGKADVHACNPIFLSRKKRSGE